MFTMEDKICWVNADTELFFIKKIEETDQLKIKKSRECVFMWVNGVC
jgi:hypothetical protein